MTTKSTKNTVLSFDAPAEVVDALDTEAKRLRVSRSWVIREIVEGRMQLSDIAKPAKAKKGGAR
jgi:predicted transcriptional regulator